MLDGTTGNKRKRYQLEIPEFKNFKNRQESLKEIDVSIGEIKHKIKLDIKSTEVMTEKKFEDLILARESENVPFVLGMAKIEGSLSLDLHPYDGNSIYKHLRNDICRPLSKEKIESVFYFTINSIKEKCFEYLMEIKSTEENEFISEFFLACNENHVESQFNIAQRYFREDGIPHNDSKGIKFLTLAANQGDPRAQFLIGNSLSYNCSGDNENMDEKEAARFYTLAANQNFAAAQYKLGECYRAGIGVDVNLTEAIRLYTLAANQGFTYAQTQLGYLYARGQGVDIDLTKAVRFYLLAANQGGSIARSQLEECLLVDMEDESEMT